MVSQVSKYTTAYKSEFLFPLWSVQSTCYAQVVTKINHLSTACLCMNDELMNSYVYSAVYKSPLGGQCCEMSHRHFGSQTL